MEKTSTILASPSGQSSLYPPKKNNVQISALSGQVPPAFAHVDGQPQKTSRGKRPQAAKSVDFATEQKLCREAAKKEHVAPPRATTKFGLNETTKTRSSIFGNGSASKKLLLPLRGSNFRTRKSVVLSSMVGLTFHLYNGKKYHSIKVKENMVGHKFGEFSSTRQHTSSGKNSFPPQRAKKR